MLSVAVFCRERARDVRQTLEQNAGMQHGAHIAGAPAGMTGQYNGPIGSPSDPFMQAGDQLRLQGGGARGSVGDYLATVR